MRKRTIKILTILLTLTLTLVAATQVLAVAAPATAQVTIKDFDTNACTPGSWPEGVVQHSDGGVATDIVFALKNVKRGTSTSWGTTILADGTYSFDVEVPAQTKPGDKMKLTIHLEDSGGSVVAQDTLTYYCGGQEEAEIPYTGIHLYSDSEQAPYLAVPNSAGQIPCGVFDVNGWGTKYVGLADFPACSAPVTVLCLNGDLEWTADSVSDVVMQGDYEVDFTSSQHGVCALFNQ